MSIDQEIEHHKHLNPNYLIIKLPQFLCPSHLRHPQINVILYLKIGLHLLAQEI